MQTKDVAQLVVSAVAPFIAAAAALLVASLQRRDRVSIVIVSDYDYNYDEVMLLVAHNRSSQPIAITSVRYLSGVLWRKAEVGTALEYDDPTDLGFPYVVNSGELRRLRLDEAMAVRSVATKTKRHFWLAWVLRRSRLLVECRTTAGGTYRVSGEAILPWDDQVSWKRGKA